MNEGIEKGCARVGVFDPSEYGEKNYESFRLVTTDFLPFTSATDNTKKKERDRERDGLLLLATAVLLIINCFFFFLQR